MRAIRACFITAAISSLLIAGVGCSGGGAAVQVAEEPLWTLLRSPRTLHNTAVFVRECRRLLRMATRTKLQ